MDLTAPTDTEVSKLAQIIDTAFADVVKELVDCKAENERLKAELEDLRYELLEATN